MDRVLDRLDGVCYHVRMTTTTHTAPTFSIPNSVTYVDSYGYGYLRATILGIEDQAKIITKSSIPTEMKVAWLMEMITREAQTANALHDAMKNRNG